MSSTPLPLWLSLLFVPVTAKRFFDGAARRGADAIILDLEEASPPRKRSGRGG